MRQALHTVAKAFQHALPPQGVVDRLVCGVLRRQRGALGRSAAATARSAERNAPMRQASTASRRSKRRRELLPTPPRSGREDKRIVGRLLRSHPRRGAHRPRRKAAARPDVRRFWALALALRAPDAGHEAGARAPGPEETSRRSAGTKKAPLLTAPSLKLEMFEQ